MTVENIPGWFSDTYPCMNSLTRIELKKLNNSAFLELAKWRAFLTKWSCLRVLVWARKYLKETLLSQNDDNRFSESLMDEGQTSSIFTPPLLRVNFTSLCMCHGNINMSVETQKDNNKKKFFWGLWPSLFFTFPLSDGEVSLATALVSSSEVQ